MSPKEIHYLLGNSCNMTCDFCFWDKRFAEQSWNTIKHICDQIISSGITRVTVSGGEPTCSKDFVKTIKYLSEGGMRVVVHSNGLLLDEELLRKIKPYARTVSLSLDGSTKEMGIRMRKKPHYFSHTIEVIDILNRLGIAVDIKTLITKVNKDDILNIGKLLETKDIQCWVLLEFIPINRGHVNEVKFLMEDSEFDSIVSQIGEVVKKNRFFPYLIRREPKTYCFIDSNGEVYTYIPNRGDVLVGDLKEEGLKSIIGTKLN